MAHETGQDPRWSLAIPHLNCTLQDGQDLDGLRNVFFLPKTESHSILVPEKG